MKDTGNAVPGQRQAGIGTAGPLHEGDALFVHSDRVVGLEGRKGRFSHRAESRIQ